MEAPRPDVLAQWGLAWPLSAASFAGQIGARLTLRSGPRRPANVSRYDMATLVLSPEKSLFGRHLTPHLALFSSSASARPQRLPHSPESQA